MPSPFPGMDPYLERPGIWETFHGMLPALMIGRLNRQIRPKYLAQIEQQVYIHERSATERGAVRPDALVVKSRGRSVMTAERSKKAPATVRLPAIDVRQQKIVKIYDKFRERVVTAIEILSPANKNPRKDFDQYLVKREQYRAAGVNLVEIDLLRRGQRMPTEEPLPAADYYVLVCRASEKDRAEVWPVSLREPLPQVPVPLDPGDADAVLDLQALFARVYEDAGWSWEIYRWKPIPPLRGADAKWARIRLAAVLPKNRHG